MPRTRPAPRADGRTGRTFAESTVNATSWSPNRCGRRLGPAGCAGPCRDGGLAGLRTATRRGRTSTTATCRWAHSARHSTAPRDLWARLDDLEREHKLPGTNPLSTGLTLADAQVGDGGQPRQRARAPPTSPREISCAGQADHRPARPAFARRRSARWPNRPARRWTRSAAGSSLIRQFPSPVSAAP